MNPKLQRNQLN
ncbi:hypothetical protein FQN60_016008 [Etheostoma spectabile]|uniref:Uncharacterized protein n=1 Tax=Etheostoma spectabile TaxID=54343 RepID=A0A5J5CA19_9PERO|nr:hypothetical protein FQN60_016008 [Etheostoma spectabile]